MPEATGYFSASTTRGFTGHEQLDPVGLVHMNGRVYDPDIGRFLSPDILIQDRFNLQSWNAYSYVHNNPLSATDPSGFVAELPVNWTPEYGTPEPGLNDVSGPVDTATITLDPDTGQPESVSLGGEDHACVSCTVAPSPVGNAVSFAGTAAGPAAVLGVGNGLALTIPIEPNLPWLGQADTVAINRGDRPVASYGGDDFLAGASFQMAGTGVLTPPGIWPDLGRLLGGRAIAGAVLSPVGALMGGFLAAMTTSTADRSVDQPYVYRALAPGENPAAGLFAANPGGTLNPANHVFGTAAQKALSPWISTTWNYAIALDFYAKGDSTRVVRIDLRIVRVHTEVLDVSTGAFPGPSTSAARKFARAHQEVLIRDEVRPEAISLFE